MAIGSGRNDRERGGEREKMKRSTIQRGTSDRIVALTRRFSIGQFGRATREQTHGKRGDRDPSGTRGRARARQARFGRNRPFRCLVSMPRNDSLRRRAGTRKLLVTRRRNACKFPNKCVISVSRTRHHHHHRVDVETCPGIVRIEGYMTVCNGVYARAESC